MASCAQEEVCDDDEASPGEVLHALEKLFKTLVEVGFLSRLTDTPEPVQPHDGAEQIPILHDALVDAKENMQGMLAGIACTSLS